MNPTTRPRLAVAAVLTAAVTALGGCSLSAASSADAGPAPEESVVMAHAGHEGAHHSPTVRIFREMRTVWAQHMEWTYAAVVAFAAGSPGLDATIARLLDNQADIGAAVRPYYGNQAADRLTDLLQTHIKEAVPVLVAAKAGDEAALQAAVTDWYANAEDIADFLAAANEAWPQGEMRRMMRMHITQTIGYASLQLQGDWAGSIAEYDKAERHMTAMADLLSEGILEQFPQRFQK